MPGLPQTPPVHQHLWNNLILSVEGRLSGPPFGQCITCVGFGRGSTGKGESADCCGLLPGQLYFPCHGPTRLSLPGSLSSRIIPLNESMTMERSDHRHYQHTPKNEGRGIPRSPTLSTQSFVHFKTTTALQENKPGDSTTPLSLISPQDDSRTHSRQPSNATTASTEEGTVADHSPSFYLAVSGVNTSARSAVDTLGSPTPTRVGSFPDIGDQARKKVKGNTEETPEEEGKGDDEDKILHLNLTQDEHIDPTSFAFKPYHIASLVDPKNLETLESMGGIKGLLAGLGVDPNSGLNIDGKAPESGDAPAVVVIDPAGEKGGAVQGAPHEGGAYTALMIHFFVQLGTGDPARSVFFLPPPQFPL